MQKGTEAFDWDDLKVLLAFARSGNLVGAGKKLGINASTVSRRLAQLESSLGVRLFDRTPDGLVLTELARGLVPRAELAEQAALAVRSRAGEQALPEGTVRLALPEALAVDAVLPALWRFRESLPSISLRILTGREAMDLSRLEADLAIRSVRPAQADLVFRQLAQVAYAPIASAAYLKRARRRRHDLARLDWIAQDFPNEIGARWLRANLPTVRPVLTATSLAVVVRAVGEGLGAAVIPVALCRSIPGLRLLPHAFPQPPSAPFWLVTHGDLRRVPRVAAVWDFIVAHVPERLAASTALRT